ncbi:MAG: ROK family protein [Chitinivibrionales bacterium]|nr:ROK family protein [Chitinivibrionales bacterium]
MNYYLGIDLGGSSVKIGVTDRQGTLVQKKQYETEQASDGPTLVRLIADAAYDIIRLSAIPKERFKAAGVGIPGVMDPFTGQLLYVVNIQILNGLFIAPLLQELLAMPVFIENDANAMILAEQSLGAARGCRHCIGLTIGTGVGGGIIIDGSLYRGVSFAAGEIGHLSIDCNGLLCNCGNYGCIERYIGRQGITDRFIAYQAKSIPSDIGRFLDNGEITPRAITAAATAGDTLALEVMQESGAFLGMALANLVNIFNPEIIVIGGGIAHAGELLLAPARHAMRKRAYTISGKHVSVVQAQFLNDAGIIGSASIAINNAKVSDDSARA